MLDVDSLTGHVRLRPRIELSRMVSYVREKIGLATPKSSGLMSAADKQKLDGLQMPGVVTYKQDGLMSVADKQKLDGLEPIHRLEDCLVMVRCNDYGIEGVDWPDFDTEYKIVRFEGGAPSEVGDTFDLLPLVMAEGGGAGIMYYFLLDNLAGFDINVVLGCSYLAPEDTVVKAGCKREASLFIPGSGELPVLTMSENLIAY